MSWRRDLQKLHEQSWSDRGLLLEALVWLGGMRAAILFLPFRHVAAMLKLTQTASSTTWSEAFPADEGAPSEKCEAERIRRAVGVASSRAPWASTCLAQALAGIAMMQRRGLGGTLYLGIAPRGGAAALSTEGLAPHAWLRCGDVLMTGGREPESYSVLGAFHSHARE